MTNQFCRRFGERSFADLTSDDALSFLNQITEGRKNFTRKIRYSQLSTFFNFIHNEIDPTFQNPCATPVIRKLFRAETPPHWDILEKETVDEVIFRTIKPRNRLILELMARRYTINFNTLLGELFVNNLLAKFNDWIDMRFYLMPESAQIFYRKALVHHDYGTASFYLNTIAEYAGLTDQNPWNLMNTV